MSANPKRRRTAGLTLLELLVVFVLLSLVSTLLIQSTGFLANRYQTVQRLHRDSASAGLRQHWFISTAEAMVPYGLEAGRFRGNAEYFEGITLQGLVAEDGMPVVARWFIDERAGQPTLVYREAPSPSAAGAEWTVLSNLEPGLRFHYADARGRWRQRWPVADAPNDWLPEAIRLATPATGTYWVARVDPTAEPLISEKDLR